MGNLSSQIQDIMDAKMQSTEDDRWFGGAATTATRPAEITDFSEDVTDWVRPVTADG